MEEEKYLQYAAILSAKISEVFDENSENYISESELEDSDNATMFIHALANVMPCYIFNTMMDENKNWIDFNHVANKLIFQYSKKEE